MLTAANKLPGFMDFLYHHYQRFYKLYSGRLTELFPCYEATDSTLSIAEDEETSESDNEQLFELWKEFKVTE